MANRLIGIGEAIGFVGAPGLPFNGIPMEFASFAKKHLGIAIGNGEYRGPAAAGTENGIVVTDIAGTGAITVDTEGRLVITTGTTDENRTQIQFKRPQFALGSTKDLTCFARLKVSTAATTDLQFGLASVDTALVTAAAGAFDVDDAILFHKVATATDFVVTVAKDSTGTNANAGLTIVDNTYFIIGFTIRGGVIRWFAKMDPNDVMANVNDAGSFLGSGTVIANTNAPDDTDLCLSIVAGQEGGTTARVVTVDWAFCTQEHL